jgi:hypothetical protein
VYAPWPIIGMELILIPIADVGDAKEVGDRSDPGENIIPADGDVIAPAYIPMLV